MRIVVAAAGRLKRGPELELVEEYLRRARSPGRTLGFSEIRIAEVEAPKGLDGAARRSNEMDLLFKAIPAGARIAALDERGAPETSAAFARMLAEWRDEGASAAGFLIGGADGLADEARAKAHRVLSFGRSTFPHLLVRVMLAEQIYRAMTILSGHPYHRA